MVVLVFESEIFLSLRRRRFGELEKCWSGVYKGPNHSRPSHLIVSLCFVMFKKKAYPFCLFTQKGSLHTKKKEKIFGVPKTAKRHFCKGSSQYLSFPCICNKSIYATSTNSSSSSISCTFGGCGGSSPSPSSSLAIICTTLSQASCTSGLSVCICNSRMTA